MFASLKQGNDSTDAIAGVCIGQPDTVLGVRYFAQPSVFAGEGATYLGEMVAGVPHGHGTLVQRNGNRFDGDWRSGKRHGTEADRIPAKPTALSRGLGTTECFALSRLACLTEETIWWVPS